MTPEQSASLAKLIAELWPNSKWTPARRAFMAQALEVIPSEATAVDAVSLIAAEDEFAPVANKIIDLARQLEARAAGHVELDHAQAFDMVLTAVSTYGYVAEEQAMASFPPAVQAAVRAVGGWKEGVCWSENLEALRAHFRQAYEATSNRVRREQHVADVLGLAAAPGPEIEPGGPRRAFALAAVPDHAPQRATGGVA